MTGYCAPWWLPGRHLQTLAPALIRWPCVTYNRYIAPFLRWPCMTYVREAWTTPDQDFIHVDSVGDESSPNWLVLFHGLEGTSRAPYARKLAARALANGWYVAMPHFRGCSGKPNFKLRDYHAGASDEVDWILREFREKHGSPVFVAGVSLGANALLKWLGETGEAAQDIVRRAVAISAPVNLHTTGLELSRGLSLLYSKLFLRFNLRTKALGKLKRFPGAYDPRRVAAAASLRDFEDSVTAPVNGFRDANHYYACASAAQFLGGIRVPTLMLNARNDPFLGEHVLHAVQRENPQVPGSALTLEFPSEGGHAGFADGQGWLAKRVLSFLGGA
jgi:predicted alpha/beta-fold hydrolase